SDELVAEPGDSLLEGAQPDSNRFFGAIATSLLGLWRSSFDANLIPLTLRYRHNRFMLVPTVVLVVLAIVLGTVWFVREPYQTLAYAGRLDQEIRSLAPQVRDIGAQESELEKWNRRTTTLDTHIRNRDVNLEALRELSRILPPDTWIGNYNFQDGSVS